MFDLIDVELRRLCDEALPADEARAFLDAMPPERRALYEDVESLD